VFRIIRKLQAEHEQLQQHTAAAHFELMNMVVPFCQVLPLICALTSSCVDVINCVHARWAAVTHYHFKTGTPFKSVKSPTDTIIQ